MTGSGGNDNNDDGKGAHVRFDSDLSDLTSSVNVTSAAATVAAGASGSVPSPPKEPPPPSEANAKPMLTSPSPPVHSTPPKFRAAELRGNLMRELVDRDPLFNYEVVKVLGVGSMGSVAKVKKRGSAIGGSARVSLQQHFSREKRMKECARIPLFGSILVHCMGWFHKVSATSDANGLDASQQNSVTASSGSSILAPQANNSGQTVEDDEGKYQVVYAMKSIHLSRVTDPTFVEELRNEVRILKRLDHPHIVRPVRSPCRYGHTRKLFSPHA